APQGYASPGANEGLSIANRCRKNTPQPPPFCRKRNRLVPLDDGHCMNYLTHMLRKLLALLVLVTGLAAIGQPAHAVVLKVDNVQAVDAGFACTSQPAQRSNPSSI